MPHCVDLHVHSTASDGVLSPEALVRLGAEQGVLYMALCDHDTVSGVEEAVQAGRACGVTVVSSIEIGSGKRGETHILGFGLDVRAPNIRRLIALMRDSRVERFHRMAALTAAQGMAVDVARILSALPPGGSPGRPHIARELVRMGYARCMKDAFERFLVPGQPCYVERWEPTPEEAIAAINRSGGVPTLAHPPCTQMEMPMLLQWIAYLKSQGLRGVECHHPCVPEGTQMQLRSYSQTQGLYVSGGSDFHDAGQGHILGNTGGAWPDALQCAQRLCEACQSG